jgi:hypothetical protein
MTIFMMTFSVQGVYQRSRGLLRALSDLLAER